jgi:hypothetical protein
MRNAIVSFVWYTQVCVNIVGLPLYYKTYFYKEQRKEKQIKKLQSRFF